MKRNTIFVSLIALALLTQTACSKRELQQTPDLTEVNKDGQVAAEATAAVRVEAESYTAMKGVQKEACREGGQNVGYIQTGDYMDYTINTTAGKYKMNFRIAGSGGSLEIRKADGTVLGKVTLPATGSGQVYATVTTEVTLPAGQQTIRIYASATGWNFNWFDYTNIAPVVIVTPTVTTNNLLLESTFESDADFSKWHKEICRASALVISREVTPRKGNGVARFEFAKTDVINYNNYVRAEIRQPSHTEAERWYGFSNYLPADFVTDPLAEKIAQWHEVPDFDKGENWRSPPISFGIENGRYYVQILWAAAAVNTNSTVDGNRKVDLGPVDKAQWNDWVFHIKFSYQSDGILEIYKNKTKVFSLYGPNSFNDRTYPYFKIGIYKWGWNGWASYSPESKRVLYYDEVRIGNAKSNLTEVSPK